MPHQRSTTRNLSERTYSLPAYLRLPRAKNLSQGLDFIRSAKDLRTYSKCTCLYKARNSLRRGPILCPPVTSSVKNLSRVWAPLVRIGLTRDSRTSLKLSKITSGRLNSSRRGRSLQKFGPYRMRHGWNLFTRLFNSKAKRR